MPSSKDLPDLGIEPTSLMSPALAGKFFTTITTQESSLGVLITYEAESYGFCLSEWLNFSTFL